MNFFDPDAPSPLAEPGARLPQPEGRRRVRRRRRQQPLSVPTGTPTTSRRASALSYQVESEDRGPGRLQPHVRTVEPGRAGHGRAVRVPHREPVGDVDRRHHAAQPAAATRIRTASCPLRDRRRGCSRRRAPTCRRRCRTRRRRGARQFNVNVQRELPWAMFARGRLRRHARLRPVDGRRGRHEPESARSAVHVARVAAQSAGRRIPSTGSSTTAS